MHSVAELTKNLSDTAAFVKRSFAHAQDDSLGKFVKITLPHRGRLKIGAVKVDDWNNVLVYSVVGIILGAAARRWLVKIVKE